MDHNQIQQKTLRVINNVEVLLPESAKFVPQKRQGKKFVQEHYENEKRLLKGAIYFQFYGFKKCDLGKPVTGSVSIKHKKIDESAGTLLVCVHKTKHEPEVRLSVVDKNDNMPHFKSFYHTIIPNHLIVFDRFLPKSITPDLTPKQPLEIIRPLTVPKTVQVGWEELLTRCNSCIIDIPENMQTVRFEKEQTESQMRGFIYNNILFLTTFPLKKGRSTFIASAYKAFSGSKTINYVIVRPAKCSTQQSYTPVLDNNPNGIAFTNGHDQNQYLYFKKIN